MLLEKLRTNIKNKQSEYFNSCNTLLNRMIDLLFNRQVRGVFTLVLLLVIALAIYKMNLHTTLIVDDYSYSYSKATGKPITNILDIFRSQYAHYFKWGGRSVTHFLAQYFLMLGKNVFNVFNTLAYMVMTLTIYLLSTSKWTLSPGSIILITWMHFSFMRVFGQVFLWLTGACNYLWGPLLALIYLLPYRFQQNKEAPILSNPILIFLLCPLGIIAGWTNENMSVALVAIITMFILSYWIYNNRLYAWSISGFIGTVIGSTLLLFAPGNFKRASRLNLNILKNIIDITQRLYNSEFLLYPLILALVFCTLSTKMNYRHIVIYFLGMLVALYSMVLSPAFPLRTESGILFLMTIVVCGLYNDLNFKDYKIKKLSLLIMAIMLCTVVQNYKIGYKDIKSYEIRNSEKVKKVLAEKTKGNLNPIVKTNQAKTRFCAAKGLMDIQTNEKHWANTGFAKYYGLKTVRVQNEKTKTLTAFRSLKPFNLITARIDVRNTGANNNDVKITDISDSIASVKRMSWIKEGGNGQFIESAAGTLSARIVCKGNGKLRIDLRGRDVRGKDGGRIPYWIDYTSLSINGMPMLTTHKSVWHDKPHTLFLEVKDNDIVKISAKWRPASEAEAEKNAQSLTNQKTETEKALKELEALKKQNKKLAAQISSMQNSDLGRLRDQ